MRINLKSKKVLVVGVAAVTVISGGAAYAYWSAEGAGTGTAATKANTLAVNAIQTSTVAEMYPGGAAQPLSGTFDNLNEGPAYVRTVTVAIGSITAPDHDSNPATVCADTNYTLDGSPITINAEVLANDTSTWTGATIAMNNSIENQDACKGATVNLVYTVA